MESEGVYLTQEGHKALDRLTEKLILKNRKDLSDKYRDQIHDMYTNLGKTTTFKMISNALGIVITLKEIQIVLRTPNNKKPLITAYQ